MARSLWRALTAIGALYALFLLALSGVNALAPQPSGLLDLSQVIALFLFVPIIVFVPFALARVGPGDKWVRQALRIGLIACVVVAIARFVPAWIPSPPPAPSGGQEIGVTTWNMEGDGPDPSVAIVALEDAEAGIVGLEELAKLTSGAITADPGLLQRFPYRVLAPRDDSRGIGLLSSYPFVGPPSVSLDPTLLQVRLDLGNGRTVDVVVTHPQPGQLRSAGVFPVDFDTSRRAAEIAAIRSVVDPILASGPPLLLLGDFNTTDREPAYHDLAAGLSELQRAVGWGPGATWRIDPVKWLPFGLLRIDMVFAGPGVVPLRISPDCAPRGSDHCIVRAAVTLQ
jgi:vancomycin resistance protein VanJ